MSKGELGRVEALARVRSKQLRLVDAARLMRVCYRQAKRLCNAINPRDVVVGGGVLDPHRPLPLSNNCGFLASGRLRCVRFHCHPGRSMANTYQRGVRNAIVKSGAVVR